MVPVNVPVLVMENRGMLGSGGVSPVRSSSKKMWKLAGGSSFVTLPNFSPCRAGISKRSVW